MHARVIFAGDGMIMGAIDYDAWALYRNLEIALLFEDATLADLGVYRVVEPDIAASQPREHPEGVTGRFRHWIRDKFTYFP